MNVMVTSAGRRDYLIDYFRDVPEVTNVIAVDADPHASAMTTADIPVVVPPFHEPDYVPRLLGAVREYDVGLLLSVNDFDALVLSGHLADLRAAGCLPMVPPARSVRLVMDKLVLGAFCRRIGVAAPRTFVSLDDATAALSDGSAAFPLVVKPRFGSASIGTYVVHDRAELRCAYAMSTYQHDRALAHTTRTEPRVLIQEHIGGTEYGLDVVNDPRGSYVAALARTKVQMRGGETDRAISVHVPALEATAELLGAALGHVGCLDSDVIVRAGVPHLLDANPRIGGGYPFVHVAGADLPAAYVAWAQGRHPDADLFDYEDGVLGMKASRVVVEREPSRSPS